jgi:hypothetical protein
LSIKLPSPPLRPPGLHLLLFLFHLSGGGESTGEEREKRSREEREKMGREERKDRYREGKRMDEK